MKAFYFSWMGKNRNGEVGVDSLWSFGFASDFTQ